MARREPLPWFGRESPGSPMRTLRQLPILWAAARAAACALFPAATLSAQDRPPGDAPPSNRQTEVRVTDRGSVELHVADLPLATVLRLLSIESRRNIIASPNVKGTVTAHLYNAKFEEALDAILIANGAGYRTAGNFIYVYTAEELARMETADRPATRVFSLNYISAADAKVYITPLLGEGGTAAVSPPPAVGIGSEAESGGSNTSAAQEMIIVTAAPPNLQEIERFLRSIDIRPRQVLIEATILRAELTDENALGIDFSIVGGVDLELLGGTSNAITDINLGQLPQDRFEQFNAAASTGFRSDVPGGGINIGIIKDQVAVFLRALEQVTDTTVLANPKVMALNKQKGQVIVGRRDGFLTTTVTETQAIQSVEFLETGTQLIFRPFIGDDGFVRVELHPEDSVGFVNAQGLPSEQTTEVTTNVLVKDGQTILIGGLFRDVTTAARKQTPGIGNIPGLGVLFRSTSDRVNREEVIILLTIHVVKDQSAFADASRGQLEDIERIHIGTRNGLMWHGRDRLAQSHERRAREALAAGDRDKALWHVNLALHNNSRFVPAMQLREDLVGERSWSTRRTGGRGFIHRLIAAEHGVVDPVFGDAEAGGPAPQPGPTVPERSPQP